MYSIKETESFKYVDTGEGKKTLLLLHGLFGAMSNFEGIITGFGDDYRVVVPILPIFELPLRKLSINALVDHVVDFVKYLDLDNIHLVGNSLGGHIALIYALDHPERVQSITLTGSSGLFENAMGSTFPKRGNYDFITRKVKETFYDPIIGTKELVDEVFEIVNNAKKGLRVVITAKSAVRQNLAERIPSIKFPVLLIWGKQDGITPEFVGEKFHELLENSQLYIFDKCGHAPMMERPELFNKVLLQFFDALDSKELSRLKTFEA